jgi:chromosome segregation ATPase
LEKFKFVLDYKIKELKRDIGPREEEIAKMKEQIANMNTEILHFKRTNANLGLIVTDLNLRQQGMKKEIQFQLTDINKNNSYMKAFEYDISESYTCIDVILILLIDVVKDFKKLKAALLKLFNKYV